MPDCIVFFLYYYKFNCIPIILLQLIIINKYLIFQFQSQKEACCCVITHQILPFFKFHRSYNIKSIICDCAPMNFIQQVEADNRERIKKYWESQSKHLPNQINSHDHFINIINVNDFGIQNYAQSSDSIKVHPPQHSSRFEHLKAEVEANLYESQVLERIKVNCSGEIPIAKQIYRQAQSQYVCSIQEFIDKGKQIKTTQHSKQSSQWKIERPSNEISLRSMPNRISSEIKGGQNTSNTQNLSIEKRKEGMKKCIGTSQNIKISQTREGKVILFQSPVRKFSQSKDASTQGNLLRYTIMKQLAQPIELIGDSLKRKSRIQKDIVPIWKLVNDKKNIYETGLGRKQYRSQQLTEKEKSQSRRGKKKLNITKMSELSLDKSRKKQQQIDSLIKTYQKKVNSQSKQIIVENGIIKSQECKCDGAAFFPCFEFLKQKLRWRTDKSQIVKDVSRRELKIHELQPLNLKEKTSQNSVDQQISSKLSCIQLLNEKEKFTKSRRRQIQNNNKGETFIQKSKSVGPRR